MRIKKPKFWDNKQKTLISILLLPISALYLLFFWINKIYLKKKQLSSELLGRGGAWLDTGSIDHFYKTSAFVSAIENRQGFKIACLEEIALGNRWITSKNIKNAMKFYGKCEYSDYLKKLI